MAEGVRQDIHTRTYLIAETCRFIWIWAWRPAAADLNCCSDIEGEPARHGVLA
jgi:hypothetical protein